MSEIALPTLTDAAAKRINAIISDEATGSMLRLAVLAGGCAGFQYEYTVTEDTQPGDAVIEHLGAKLVVDEMSQTFLNGSIVDFVTTIMDAGFKIQNPGAESGCGCGTSFSYPDNFVPG